MSGKSKTFNLGSHSETKKIVASMKNYKGVTKKLQMNINEDLHRRFKIQCAAQSTDMTTVIEEFITDWLSRGGKIG